MSLGRLCNYIAVSATISLVCSVVWADAQLWASLLFSALALEWLVLTCLDAEINYQ